MGMQGLETRLCMPIQALHVATVNHMQYWIYYRLILFLFFL